MEEPVRHGDSKRGHYYVKGVHITKNRFDWIAANAINFSGTVNALLDKYFPIETEVKK